MPDVVHFDLLLQGDLAWGADLASKRNPSGGYITDYQIGLHSFAVGKVAVETEFHPTGAIPALAIAQTQVVVPGAGLGDFVVACLTEAGNGLFVSGQVTAPDRVTVTFFNSGNTPMAAEGSVRVVVLRARSF
jgi:hypothetical protein